MIKLHSSGPSFRLIDASPFVAKVKLFMIMHDISFTEANDLNKLSKATKQKFPYIDDGLITVPGQLLKHIILTACHSR